MACRCALTLLCVGLIVPPWLPAFARGFENRPAPKSAKIDFAKTVKPLLITYCYDCHGVKKKGGMDLRIYVDERTTLTDRRVFEKILTKLQAHEMPPEKKPQPAAGEYRTLTNWIGLTFFNCDCDHPDPGRVTIRRLNRAEYRNTIRDLLSIDFHPANDFPADDSGYGFDNIGDVLSLSPVLMEKYLAAAETIMTSILNPGAPNSLSPTNLVGANSFSSLIAVTAGQPKADRGHKIITDFATRAFRRPLSPTEQQRFFELFAAVNSNGESLETCLKVVCEAVLVSPQFLFRGDTQSQPDNPRGIMPVDEYTLASRLSYFLWSSMPDKKLFDEAGQGALRRNLKREVNRMLDDPKAHALVENFAGQWLQLRDLKLISPDRKEFPAFNDTLRNAMQKETELFFASICKDNRSVLEFISANYSFLNEKLAGLYGINGVDGEDFRRVTFDQASPRGGLLTQASILTLNSNPTRTSPVKRGKWVLENILGEQPPPPPPNVPELKEGKEALKGTLRQRMEQHRSDPNCASCHARMDPIGFAFEHFDGIGAWREREGDFGIDASGKLSSGESFSGAADLKSLLVRQRRNDFVHCLVEKMLTYALGRGVEYYDRCAVDRIAQRLAKDNYRFRTLVLEIVKSAPFQMQRGEGEAGTIVAASSESR